MWVAPLRFDIARQRWQDPKQDGKHRQGQSGRDGSGRRGTPAFLHRLQRSEHCRGDHHYGDEPQPGINLPAALGFRVIKEPDLKQQGSGDGDLNRDDLLEILNRHGATHCFRPPTFHCSVPPDVPPDSATRWTPPCRPWVPMIDSARCLVDGVADNRHRAPMYRCTTTTKDHGRAAYCGRQHGWRSDIVGRHNDGQGRPREDSDVAATQSDKIRQGVLNGRHRSQRTVRQHL
jgi:hypothetical protein